jgi:hypothetical protein
MLYEKLKIFVIEFWFLNGFGHRSDNRSCQTMLFRLRLF